MNNQTFHARTLAVAAAASAFLLLTPALSAAPPPPTATPRPTRSATMSRHRPAPSPTPMRVAGSAPLIDTNLSLDQLSVSPSQVAQGERVDVTFRYNNRGQTQAVAFPCRITYHKRAQRNFLPDPADLIRLSDQPCPPLGPGQSVRITRSVQIPQDIPISGSERIEARLVINVIESPGIPESPEREEEELRRALDNWATVPITVVMGPRPDLSVNAVQMVGNPWTSSTFDLLFQVSNTGERPAQSSKIRISVRSHRVLRPGVPHWAGATTTGDALEYTREVAERTLYAGVVDGRRVTLESPASSDYDYTSFTFVVVVDADRTVVESVETNNRAELTVQASR